MAKKKKKSGIDRLDVTGVTITPDQLFADFVDETVGVKCGSNDIFSDKLNKRFDVYLNSQRYLLFKQSGYTCVECGLVADQCILIAEPNGNNRGHFEFVGVKSNGQRVIMTKDHIVPRALGGKDVLENYQPMCQDCNGMKKDDCTTADLKEAILNRTADAIPNVWVELNVLDPLYHAMFVKWADVTCIKYEYQDDVRTYKFMPETRAQKSFISSNGKVFANILKSTCDWTNGKSIDKINKNSIFNSKKEIQMNLYEEIKNEKIKQMKDRNHGEVGILSVLLGEIDRPMFNMPEAERNDESINKLVAVHVKKLISTAQENYNKFKEDGYQKEIEVISRWLSKLPEEPKVLDEAESKNIIDGLVAIHGNSKKSIGKIMGDIGKTYGATVNKTIAKSYLDTLLV